MRKELDLRMGPFVAAFGEQEFVDVQEVAVVGEELAGAVDLQGVDLVERCEFVPAGYGAGHFVTFGRGFEDALFGGEVGFFVGGRHVMPESMVPMLDDL